MKVSSDSARARDDVNIIILITELTVATIYQKTSLLSAISLFLTLSLRHSPMEASCSVITLFTKML